MRCALEVSRHLWNNALAHRKARWENERQSTSYNLQASILTFERERDIPLSEIYSQVGQDILRRLDRAFKSFLAHRTRYPQFKKFCESGSFTYPQGYNGSVRLEIGRKRLFLSKIGNVKTIFHRALPRDARLKTCTVIREPDGKWFASLVFEEVVPLQNIERTSIAVARTPIGVDLGLLSLVTISNGERVEHPHLLRKAEKRLKHLQRLVSRKKKGSKNRFKARRRVASQHAKVKRQRLDFNHKLSTRLVREHDFIAFEDLKIKNMGKNRKLAKSIYDAAWGQLVKLTEYKTLRAGSRTVRVPAAYSTQECYYCGTLNKIDLRVRVFVCVGCGITLWRDFNAASVVLKRGLAMAGLTAAKVGQDMPELKPVEMEPLLIQTSGGVSSVCEAGTTGPQRARSPRPLAVGGCHYLLDGAATQTQR
jgi:putative transposase